MLNKCILYRFKVAYIFLECYCIPVDIFSAFSKYIFKLKAKQIHSSHIKFGSDCFTILLLLLLI